MWIGYAALMVFAEYCFLALQIKIWRAYGQSYCMLDCMHALELPWNFGLFYLPVTTGWILTDRKIYQYTAFVLQYEKRERIWSSSVRDISVKALLCTGIYGAIACFLSGLSSYEVINWKNCISLYYQINETLYQGNAAAVFFAFFLLNTVKTVLMVLMLMLFENAQKGLLIGYILLGLVVVVEWCCPGIRIFLNAFSIAQRNFKHPGTIRVLECMGIVLISMMYLVGKRIFRKKEFYE